MEFTSCFKLRNSVPPANVALTPLKCLALGVFQDSVPVHLRTPLGPEYSVLFLDVLRPFFLTRQRCLGLGDYFIANDVKFKVLGCEPAFGLISAQTLIQCYESLVEAPIHRLQFAAISPGSLTEQVFMTTIRPYFRAQPRHIHKDQYLSFQGINCLVVAVEPRNGVVTRQTEIFFEQSPLEQFRNVKLSPIGDSLPAELAGVRGIALTQLLQGHYILPYLKGWRRPMALNSDISISGITFRVTDSDRSHGFAGEQTIITYNGEVVNRNMEQQMMDEAPILRLTMLPNGQLVVIDDRREAFLRQMMQMEGLLALLDHSGMQGADQSTINSLPVRRIDTVDENQSNCTVCLTEFIIGDEVRTLPCCELYSGHNFHKTCIDEWLLRSKNCPLCKHPIDAQQ